MPLYVLPVMALLLIPECIVAFGEEYGWRGYLLPRLMPLGEIKASLIVGVIWSLWHLPALAGGNPLWRQYPLVGFGDICVHGNDVVVPLHLAGYGFTLQQHASLDLSWQHELVCKQVEDVPGIRQPAVLWSCHGYRMAADRACRIRRLQAFAPGRFGRTQFTNIWRSTPVIDVIEFDLQG